MFGSFAVYRENLPLRCSYTSRVRRKHPVVRKGSFLVVVRLHGRNLANIVHQIKTHIFCPRNAIRQHCLILFNSLREVVLDVDGGRIRRVGNDGFNSYGRNLIVRLGSLAYVQLVQRRFDPGENLRA